MPNLNGKSDEYKAGYEHYHNVASLASDNPHQQSESAKQWNDWNRGYWDANNDDPDGTKEKNDAEV